jgi:hypothetical protein
MNPKKNLPEGSEKLAQLGRYILIKSTLNKEPYYSIYEFYDGSNGRRYWPRGASSSDFNSVRFELERITGRKLEIKSSG